ncbi:MAG: hypothetical protein V5A27_13015 [Halapricum sp.]
MGDDGIDPSLGQAVIPIGGTLAVIVALVSIASTDRRQRVFGIVADTYVVGADIRTPSKSRPDTSDSGPYDFDDFGTS